MRHVFLAFWLAGCCGRSAPTWKAVDPVYLGGESTSMDLLAWVDDDRGDPIFSVVYDNGDVIAEMCFS